ncbi:MAG: hypothetical protein ACRDCE_15500 [Cetobacterium sp.]|uniref:hypothetical protein n=1 Tax=Cetobacterium sp. TaxID=2071632 RepID=UPI003EE6BA00
MLTKKVFGILSLLSFLLKGVIMSFSFFLSIGPFAFLARMGARLLLHVVGPVLVYLVYDKTQINPMALCFAWFALMGVASAIFTFLFIGGFEERIKQAGSGFYTFDRFIKSIGEFYLLGFSGWIWYDVASFLSFLDKVFGG